MKAHFTYGDSRRPLPCPDSAHQDERRSPAREVRRLKCVGWIGYVALTMLFLAFSEAANAQFVWKPVRCPLWNYDYKSPEKAAEAALNGPGSQFPSSCKPILITGCVPRSDGPAGYNCDGVLSATCWSQPTGYWARGSGPPGSGITRGVFSDNLTYCQVQLPFDWKNLGHQNCPTGNCGSRGNPVNATTGNKYEVQEDFAGTPDGTLRFTRHYNSAKPLSEEHIGSAWGHEWSRSLFFALGGVQVHRPDGKVYEFTQSGPNWVTDADIPERLVSLGTAGWQYTTLDNEVESYSAAGVLTSFRSRSGLVTTFGYSDGTASGPNGAVYLGTTTPLPADFLLRATDHAGRTLQFAYGSSGDIAQMTDPSGAVYTYSYDASGRLVGVLYPNGGTRTYLYNEPANTSGADLPWALTGIIDENGARYATFKYASDRRAISTEHGSGVEKYQFAYGSGTTSIVDPLGTSRTMGYSTILGVRQVTSQTQTCPGCGGTMTETYTFDAARNRTSATDFNGNLTCYTNDVARALETSRTEGLSGSGTCASRVTTSATRTISTEWHPTWRLPARIAEPLRVTTYAYNGDPGVSCAPAGAATTLVCSKTVQATTDANGSLAFSATADGPPRTWTYTYNSLGKPLTVDGPRTDVADLTTFSYYASADPQGGYRAGDLQSITNAKGQVTSFTRYDGAGRLLRVVDPNGLETLLSYHPRGWLASRQVGVPGGAHETTSYSYDPTGQLTQVTMPDGSTVAYSYDAAHRLTDIQDGLGNRIHYTLDAMGNRVAESAYDPSNTPVRAHSRVIDALNRLAKDIGGTQPATQVTTNSYDANGNLVSVLDPLGRATSQAWDARNRLSQVVDPFNGASAPTRYGYNGQDQLVSVTDPQGLSTTYVLNGVGELVAQSSPDTGSTSFTYDAASNLKSKLDARGVQANYAYDELNRVTQITYPDETVAYAYDSCANGIGRLCSISDSTGTTSYAYDPWGRVASKSRASGSLTQTVGYAYNAAGQLAQITMPSGRKITYGYQNNRPVSVAVDGQPVLDSVVYEPFGPNGGWRWGNSTAQAPNYHLRLFDLDFRATSIRSDQPASATQASFEKRLTWDVQGRVQSLSDLANASLNATYGYDALDRLTSASQGSGNWSFTYSGVGDRLASTGSSGASSYAYAPGSHRLTQVTGVQGRTFSFDAAGNVTGDGTRTWVYGGNGRARQVVTGTASTRYGVNALGQRVSKLDGSGNQTVFAYDEAGRLLGEYDGAGAPLSETVWLDDLPVAVVR